MRRLLGMLKKKKTESKPKAPAPHKKFSISFEIEGRMVDKDTPTSVAALEDYFNMHFSCPKGLKIERLRVQQMD